MSIHIARSVVRSVRTLPTRNGYGWPQNAFLGRNVHSVARNGAVSEVLRTQNANLVGETHSVSIE